MKKNVRIDYLPPSRQIAPQATKQPTKEVASRTDVGPTDVPNSNTSERFVEESLDSLEPTRDSGLIDSHTSTALFDNLLNHFALQVASRLQWIDGPDNPWRCVILPLTHKSSCLRLSTAGLAAAHLSATDENGKSTDLMHVNHNLREASLRELNTKLQSELSRDLDTGEDSGLLVEILATTLVLCYGEILTPYSTDWNLHLRACRILIDRNMLHDKAQPQDCVTKFVIKEVFELEVLRGIFSFSEENIPRHTPELTIPNNFWKLTSLNSEITTTERYRYDMLRKGHALPDTDMSIWQAKIKQAWMQTLANFTCRSEFKDTAQECFHSIIEVHYLASLIYSYQALASAEEAKSAIHSLVDELFDKIESVTAEPSSTFTHDFFLPLFIAGTEYKTEEQKEYIRTLFLKLVPMTGIWCNHAALRFLYAFWERQEDQQSSNWIQYARENEHEVGPFVIF